MTKPAGVFIQLIGAALLVCAAADMVLWPVVPGLVLMFIGRKRAKLTKHH